MHSAHPKSLNPFFMQNMGNVNKNKYNEYEIALASKL